MTFDVDYASANQFAPGLLTGIKSINNSAGFDENVIMVITKINNKYVIMGFGRVKPGTDDPYQWENFVMVQVD